MNIYAFVTPVTSTPATSTHATSPINLQHSCYSNADCGDPSYYCDSCGNIQQTSMIAGKCINTICTMSGNQCSAHHVCSTGKCVDVNIIQV